MQRFSARLLPGGSGHGAVGVRRGCGVRTGSSAGQAAGALLQAPKARHSPRGATPLCPTAKGRAGEPRQGLQTSPDARPLPERHGEITGFRNYAWAGGWPVPHRVNGGGDTMREKMPQTTPEGSVPSPRGCPAPRPRRAVGELRGQPRQSCRGRRAVPGTVPAGSGAAAVALPLPCRHRPTRAPVPSDGRGAAEVRVSVPLDGQKSV